MVRRLETHSPKPIHGWRDFLKEVAIIVLGVVIALSADEAVDAYNWHKDVGIVEDSLNDELADALFAAHERMLIADCQRRILDRLDELADQSRGTLVIRNKPVSRNRVWGYSAWDAAVASGTIAHMAHDERNAYAALYSFLPLFRDLNLRQQELWAKVEAYRRPRVFTDESRDRFVETVAQLRSLTGTMNLAARQFVDAARPLHIRISEEDAAKLRQPLVCPMP